MGDTEYNSALQMRYTSNVYSAKKAKVKRRVAAMAPHSERARGETHFQVFGSARGYCKKARRQQRSCVLVQSPHACGSSWIRCGYLQVIISKMMRLKNCGYSSCRLKIQDEGDSPTLQSRNVAKTQPSNSVSSATARAETICFIISGVIPAFPNPRRLRDAVFCVRTWSAIILDAFTFSPSCLVFAKSTVPFSSRKICK